MERIGAFLNSLELIPAPRYPTSLYPYSTYRPLIVSNLDTPLPGPLRRLFQLLGVVSEGANR